MAHQWPSTPPLPLAAAAPLLFLLRLSARWSVLGLRRPLGTHALRGRPRGRVRAVGRELLPLPLLRHHQHDPGQKAVEPRDLMRSVVATCFVAFTADSRAKGRLAAT